jgi:hypothetical protein
MRRQLSEVLHQTETARATARRFLELESALFQAVATCTRSAELAV